MKSTPQGTISVWEHGKQVAFYLEKFLSRNYSDLPRIDKVTWLSSAITSLRSISTQSFLNDLHTYALFHDIGKTITHVDGHYPNHAQVSADIWRQLDPREHVARWIENDMAIHTMSQEEFSKLPDRDKHRLVGLAEVYANAEMFGGFDSDSFKIKLKKVIRNGNY